MTRILIVEDNPMNLKLMETILSKNGYDLVSAVDGEKGVQRAGEQKLDLVLMDLQMPGIDGFEAMAQIRKLDQCSALPIIAVTGNTTQVDKKKAIEAGFNDFLGKPYKIDELLRIIEQAVA